MFCTIRVPDWGQLKVVDLCDHPMSMHAPSRIMYSSLQYRITFAHVQRFAHVQHRWTETQSSYVRTTMYSTRQRNLLQSSMRTWPEMVCVYPRLRPIINGEPNRLTCIQNQGGAEAANASLF